MSWEPLPESEPPLRDLATVLGRLHTTMGLARPDVVTLLSGHWTALLGSELAPHCELESVRSETLVVSVDDPAIAEHLRWNARDLLAAANSLVGAEVLGDLVVRVRGGRT